MPEKKLTSKKKRLRLWLRVAPVAMLMGILIVIIVCRIISTTVAADKIYFKVDKLPKNKFGLVLGTSKTVNGDPNPFFDNRMKATALLYHQGKIEYIIASGARHETTGYDGPKDMKAALIELKVPADRIIEDCLGYRTLDSIHRAKDVFELDKFTVISQESHIVRAVYIAKDRELDVVAFAADECEIQSMKFTNTVRESFARVKMMLDLYLLETGAKFPEKRTTEIKDFLCSN